MRIGIPKEIHLNESRVSCTPDEVKKLGLLGHSVLIEHNAGQGAGFLDRDFESAGATIVDSGPDLWDQAEIICKVRAPEFSEFHNKHEAEWLAADKTLISFIWPAQNAELMRQMSESRATVLAMDSVPRISRAQKMDALSSMANVAGYRSVIEAGQHFGRFFTGQITAAGKVPPAKVMIIGAGVAGLAAIGAAVSLGAIVRAFDTRPEVKEQIESMSAEFLELDFKEDGSGTGGYAKVMSEEFIKAEMALFAEQAKEVDIIITTALIPGKPAPKLITREMVQSMKHGSVIVDLAAEQGGNCELTQPDQVVSESGVKIIGYTDHPSRMAAQSSQLYAANIRHLMSDLSPEKDGSINVNMEDEAIRGATVINRGDITWPPPAPKLSAKPATKPQSTNAKHTPEKESVLADRGWTTLAGIAIGVLAILGVGSVAPVSFMNHFIVFVLACFVGWQVIWSVSPALHTPLMSVTNAISGIIVIGALLQIGSPSSLGTILALLAVILASINIAGGFLVTHRMLKMFQK
ncbi:MAG: Re/Si-specific NAD(P)(+) transhydrogenase subunit alpha [Gammaproteobacteria bacterium]|nr:Re/Si-specific NAD(P)(+) transhydrogenase subunit alpha [Gammaproteobacteria bacterium]